MKLSIHDAWSGLTPATRLAFTTGYAKAHNLDERLLASIGQRTSIGHGWHHELTIATPTTTFGTFSESPPLRGSEKIQWWTPPTDRHQLAFHVYIGDPGYQAITLTDHVGNVVQMPLTNGRALWIIARCEPMSDEVEAAIKSHVAGLPTDPTLVHPFTFFHQGGDNVPLLLDLAALHRPPAERKSSASST
ncbi:hypothetical protein NJBCHELONAE_31250 [Mycobacteroides chelonae]|nr:hypothetical protein NJBCHELONAE_31250 [Mycobacteroides chelonae]